MILNKQGVFDQIDQSSNKPMVFLDQDFPEQVDSMSNGWQLIELSIEIICGHIFNKLESRLSIVLYACQSTKLQAKYRLFEHPNL